MRVYMISSYPSQACGVSKYSAKLMEGLEETSIKSSSGRIFFQREKRSLFKWFIYLWEAIKDDADIVHIQYTPTICGPLFPLFVLLLRVMRPKVGIVITVHEKAGVYEKYLNALTTLLFQWYEGLIFRTADKIIVHTAEHMDEILGKYSLKESKVVVIPFAVDNVDEVSSKEIEEYKNRYALKDKTIITFFGALRPAKGVEYLVLAFANTLKAEKDLSLVIAGFVPEGCEDYLYSIKDLVEKLKINEHVRITGHVQEAEIPAMMASSDILVLPYVDATQSAVLHSEVIAYEKPVIVTDVGGLGEVVRKHDIGIVVPKEDAFALAESIRTLINNNEMKERFITNMGIMKEDCSWGVIVGIHKNTYYDIDRDKGSFRRHFL